MISLMNLIDPRVAGYSYGASVYVLDELIACLDHTDSLYK